MVVGSQGSVSQTQPERFEGWITQMLGTTHLPVVRNHLVDMPECIVWR